MRSDCTKSSPPEKRHESLSPAVRNEVILTSASSLFQNVNRVVHSSVTSVNSAARSSVSSVNIAVRSGVTSVNHAVQSSVSSVNSSARSVNTGSSPNSSIASVNSAVQSSVNKLTSFTRKKSISLAGIGPSATKTIHCYSETSTCDNEDNSRFSPSLMLDAETFIANRYMCSQAHAFPVNSLLLEEYNLTLSVSKFRGGGPSFLNSGVDVSISYALTGESFDGGARLTWNNNMYLENKKGYTVAMSFGELLSGGMLLCGSNPILASDTPVEKYFTKRYFPCLRARLHDNSLAVDVWNGKDYVPLWKADDVLKNDTVIIFSLRNNTILAQLTMSGNWNLRSKLGLDPALFICLAGVIIRLRSESYVQPDVLASLTNTQANSPNKVTTKARRAFRVVKGVVELPFKSLTHQKESDTSVAGDSIWVGPNTIIQHRCLCKKYETLGKQTKSYELSLLLGDKRAFLQQNGTIQIKDCETGELFVGGSELKLGAESFGLKDAEGKPVARCLTEDVNKRSLICGVSPLFPTDKPNGYAGKLPYYPWMKFQIDENEMAVDLWSGHTFTPLWYSENIPIEGIINVISAENDNEIIGHISLDGTLKSTSGIDPSLFICLGALVIKFNETRSKGVSSGSVRGSHLFKVVNGEVLAPFQSTSTIEIDSDDEENAHAFVSSDIWVGPD